jgi:hypothetical protein
MKWCHRVEDIPKGDHYAIIEFKTISIPGDERSRTNPGHGYPASTESYSEYIAFTDRAEWEKEKEIINRSSSTQYFGRKEFVALEVKRAEKIS